jgi:hypothetical protein
LAPHAVAARHASKSLAIVQSTFFSNIYIDAMLCVARVARLGSGGRRARPMLGARRKQPARHRAAAHRSPLALVATARIAVVKSLAILRIAVDRRLSSCGAAFRLRQQKMPTRRLRCTTLGCASFISFYRRYQSTSFVDAIALLIDVLLRGNGGVLQTDCRRFFSFVYPPNR